MTVLADLHGSRPAFGTSSERDMLLRLIDGVLPRRDVSWLEVGAGDGNNLKFLLERLCKDRRIEALAVDPDVGFSSIETERFVIRAQKARIEDVATSQEVFDFIHVRHSAYYFQEPDALLRRLFEALKPTGAMCLTIWSERCILYKLHGAVRAATDQRSENILTAARIIEIARAFGCSVCVHGSESAYNTEAFSQAREVALSLVRLAARGISLDGLSQAHQLRLLNDIVRSDPDRVRSNFTVVIVRQDNQLDSNPTRSAYPATAEPNATAFSPTDVTLSSRLFLFSCVGLLATSFSTA